MILTEKMAAMAAKDEDLELSPSCSTSTTASPGSTSPPVSPHAIALERSWSFADDVNDQQRLISFSPLGPKEPEMLHSWKWLTEKWPGFSFLLNERLREVREQLYIYVALSRFEQRKACPPISSNLVQAFDFSTSALVMPPLATCIHRLMGGTKYVL